MTRNLIPQNRRKPRRDGERSQMLIIFLLFGAVLVLFIGLGIDVGFAYITKAQLSKAVDAAALAGMSNFYQGSATASNIAAGAFSANFAPGGKTPGNVATMPVPQLNFGTDAAGNQTLTVSATAIINTFFIRILPQWKALTVGDTGQATRSPVIMTLVLDHSGSMDPNCSGGGCTGGGAYLPGAVAKFIAAFEDNVDNAAVVTFGSSVTNLVTMTSPFIGKVTAAANSLATNWGGGTCSVGGLTNALILENSVVSTATVVKAVVFFTDGLANMIEANASCPTGVSQPWNFGGWLSGGNVGFWATNTPYTVTAQSQGEACSTAYSPTCCTGSSDKYPSFDGTQRSFTMDNVIYDATNRCILVANQMRAAGIYVYCIGLSAAANGDVPAPDFLRQVANDRASPTHDPNQPVGEALVTGNGADLTQLFQQIAGDIQLRLTY
jgi:Flp pilus assembly protein TadG